MRDETVKRCPLLSSFIIGNILNHKTLEKSIAFILSNLLGCSIITSVQWYEIFCREFQENENIQLALREDLKAIKQRDPACPSYAHALLYMKGFHGVTSHRVAHNLFKLGRKDLAYCL